MELEDLKTDWKKNNVQKTKNINIMELIQQKSHGPVASLKRAFKKQIAILALMPFLLISTNIKNPGNVFTSILFWSYVVLCAGMIAFGYVNYKLAGKMEIMDSNLKARLTQQIDTLKKRLRLKMIALRIAGIFFVALFETVPYLQHYRMLDKWHGLPIAVRCGAYVVFFLFIFFLSRIINERKYGKHLAYLKALVDEME